MTHSPTATARLEGMLRAARARTLTLASDLTGEQLLGPRLTMVNPPLWELGHLAWFQERWCLRASPGGLAPSILNGADALYDSSAVAHSTRWDLPLPKLDATLGYLAAVLARVLERLASGRAPSIAYFAELAAWHEEMHCEAFSYTRQTLGYPRPPDMNDAPAPMQISAARGDARVEGGEFLLGATPGAAFVFDNEKWAHRVRVASFSMARTCVTHGEFAAFVDDDGYGRPELWSSLGSKWRDSAQARHPGYWRREGNAWYERFYDRWRPLPENAAVVHVNRYEAEAYCRWAGRRLPTEAEWEYAASTSPDAAAKRAYPWGDASPARHRANLYPGTASAAEVDGFAAGDSAWGVRQLLGNVWEWTASSFEPYPGFVPDPYKEYSQPWFGNHDVLRGGSFATRAELVRNTWRNFYTPDRRDVFAGFRTCAADT